MCVLTGHGLKDPQTAMNRAAPGDARASPTSRAWRRRCWADEPPPRWCGCRRPRPTSGPGYDALAAALSLDLELEVEETGEFFGALRRAGRARRPHQPLRARLRDAAPRRRPRLPASARRSRSAAGLGSSAAAIVAGLCAADHMYELDAPIFELARELEGHPDNVAAALLRRLRDLRRRRAGALRPAARASRACWRSRPSRCRPPRRARRCRPRCRSTTPCTTWRTPRC